MFDGPIENADLRVISLGAGVQSTVMALMASHGEIEPMPDVAIFADTQWESEAIYEHLDWLEKQLPFPVYRVSAGNIREMVIDAVQGKTTRNTDGKVITASLPLYAEGDTNKFMLYRQCTAMYKIRPLEQKIKQLLGVGPNKSVPSNLKTEQWIGISLDEIHRAKDSRNKWATHRYPLIEKRLTRYACQLWFEKHYPERQLMKSACIGCPYHNDDTWRTMKESDPKSWNDAVAFDEQLRSQNPESFLLVNTKSKVYLHKYLKPLNEVDFANETDKGQLDMFGEECEGMCGV